MYLNSFSVLCYNNIFFTADTLHEWNWLHFKSSIRSFFTRILLEIGIYFYYCWKWFIAMTWFSFILLPLFLTESHQPEVTTFMLFSSLIHPIKREFSRNLCTTWSLDLIHCMNGQIQCFKILIAISTCF